MLPLRRLPDCACGSISVAVRCRCGGFEAGGSRGYLWVSVSNPGYLPASYTLTVSGLTWPTWGDVQPYGLWGALYLAVAVEWDSVYMPEGEYTLIEKP